VRSRVTLSSLKLVSFLYARIERKSNVFDLSHSLTSTPKQSLKAIGDMSYKLRDNKSFVFILIVSILVLKFTSISTMLFKGCFIISLSNEMKCTRSRELTLKIISYPCSKSSHILR